MAKITGAQCLADMLAGYGVSHVFMVPAVLRRTFAEMERRTKIKRIHTHGEKSAAYMADGYARASGRPGICMAQVIGALNLAAGLRDAHLAHSPVIAFTGGRDPKTKFRRVYQEVDDVPAFEPVTKFNATVDAVERFPDMVRQAFRVAVSGTPGPVHLQFRGNEGQVDAEEAEIEPLVEERFARVPPFRPEPDMDSVLTALKILQEAERPVIVAGGGVRASGAKGELVALAEKLSIPVATSLNGKDSIPGVHPLSVGVSGTYSRESANRVIGQADLVCFVGTETGGMTTNFWTAPRMGVGAVQKFVVMPPVSCSSARTRRPRRGENPGSSRRDRSAGNGIRNTVRCSNPTRSRSGPSACARSSRGTCPTTASSWSTPATPACGWAGCTICVHRRRAI
ncbi:MAG: thiamine pyrophosphate-binding protein [Betaproteobacteria bacterium]|nr:MAG: thiamine pyrophosphate-binding protein [Betaproteobacteria bacterium]